jgi:putative heme iron utilization protein
MSEEFSPEISSRICGHMNKDHGDAIALYAQAYGGITTAVATMDSIDAEGMNLTAEVNGEALPVRIQFDHVLANAEDAHHTLVAMIKQARVPK